MDLYDDLFKFIIYNQSFRVSRLECKSIDSDDNDNNQKNIYMYICCGERDGPKTTNKLVYIIMTPKKKNNNHTLNAGLYEYRVWKIWVAGNERYVINTLTIRVAKRFARFIQFLDGMERKKSRRL